MGMTNLLLKYLIADLFVSPTFWYLIFWRVSGGPNIVDRGLYASICPSLLDRDMWMPSLSNSVGSSNGSCSSSHPESSACSSCKLILLQARTLRSWAMQQHYLPSAMAMRTQ
eukprot:4023458-Amphidinium_carterae.1